jgi:hypothetical protein
MAGVQGTIDIANHTARAIARPAPAKATDLARRIATVF